MIAKVSSPQRRRAARKSGDVFASFLSKDNIRSFAKFDLPEDVRVAVISSAKIKGMRLHKLRRVQLSNGRTAAVLDYDMAPVVLEQAAPAPSARAFEPGARARALLRGIEKAEVDLAGSGGAFDFPQLQLLLHGVSRQRVDQRVQDGSILAVPGPSNRRRFPVLQFDADGNLIAGLDRVRNSLGSTSPWAMLNFLANPLDELGGRKPIELLSKGQIEPVLEVARRHCMQGA